MRDINAFTNLKALYDKGEIQTLDATQYGLFFLKLRSVARKENYEFVAQQAGIDLTAVQSKDYLSTLFVSDLTSEQLDEFIKALHLKQRESRQVTEDELVIQLYKLRVFDWGGVHSNDINKYIVDNYIKKYDNYEELENAIDSNLVPSVRGFTLCSWYNHWSSILIEDIFKENEKVQPTVGQIKMVDFFIEEIPFDLKVTYFPAGFMKLKRREMKLVLEEVSELKQLAKKFSLPFDKDRPAEELKLDLIAMMEETSNDDLKGEYLEFVERRRTIIEETINNPKDLIKWLYEEQGTQRFDASNRIFLVLVDLDNLEESWKLKRDLPLLRKEIHDYLNETSFDKESLKVQWQANNISYESYADCIFITKSSKE